MATRGFNTWRWLEWKRPGTSGEGGDVVLSKYTWKGTNVSSWTNREIIPAVALLDAVFQRFGYKVKSAGSYNYRKITGGTVFSPHAWALAIDINPASNPYTGTLVTDIALPLIEDVYTIRAANQRVWKWGGDWDGDWNFDEHTVFDAMHFEIIATPAELAAGVYFSDEINQPEVEMLKFGDKGLAVYDMKAGLSGYFKDEAIFFSSADPQLFDAPMVETVKQFQRNYGLAVTGNIDGVTAVEIRSWVRPRNFV